MLYILILIDEDDLFDAQKALIPTVAKWKAIGTGLGIKRGRLDEIETAHPGDPSECLAETLTTWLRKGYNVKRFGEPTWQKLVQAVSDPAAGNNPALAMTIAKNYACKYNCNRIHVVTQYYFTYAVNFMYIQLILHHFNPENKGQISLMEV